jgi:protein SCO1/2
MQEGSAQLGTVAPQSQAGMANDEPDRAYFSDRRLVTQDGNEVKFYTDLLKDKVVLIQFIYTRCAEACPLTTKQLADTQKLLGKRLGRDIYFLSISVDPQRDTPEHLKAYSQQFKAGKGWLFLTGHKEDVGYVTNKLGQVSPVIEGHLPIFLLGNVRTGHWLKMQPYSAPSLIAEQLLALADEK